jgi:Resolvase, N terminal domain
VSFLLKLIDSGVEVLFADLPELNGAMGRFMLTTMASVAELEAGLISERTKAALKPMARVKRTGEMSEKWHCPPSRCAVGFPFPNLLEHRQKQLFRFFVRAAQGLTPQHYGVTGRHIRIIKRSDRLGQVNVFSSGD